MFGIVSNIVIGLLRSIYGLSASVVAGAVNTVVSGMLIVRQSTGVAGTDELQISHNGTTAFLNNVNSSTSVVAIGTPAGADKPIQLDSILFGGSGANGYWRSSGTSIELRNDAVFKWSSSDTATAAKDTGVSRVAAGQTAFGNGISTNYASAGISGFILGSAAGASASSQRFMHKKTSIADNTATAFLTVTVPNANHAAAIKLTFLASNGSTDAFESSRCAEGMVVVARTTGANAVAVVATLDLAQIATVAAGATLTLAYGVSAISGAVGATNTFDVQVTIDDSGNLGSNQLVVLVEVINAEESGVTVAAV